MTLTLAPFQQLLDAHGRDVHRFLIALVGPDDADDCYQETWLAALRAYPRLRAGSNVRSWILTIAHHKAIDQLRARRRRAVAVGAIAEDALGTVDEPSPAARAEADVWACVRKLPGKQRTAIALRFVADAAYQRDRRRDGDQRRGRSPERPRGPETTARGVSTR